MTNLTEDRAEPTDQAPPTGNLDEQPESAPRVPSATERWQTACVPSLVRAAEHCAHTSGITPDKIQEHFVAGMKSGIRPARSLMVAGLLGAGNYREFFLPASPAEPPQPETSESTAAPPDMTEGDEPLQYPNGRPISLEEIDRGVAFSIEFEAVRRMNLLPFGRDENGKILVATEFPPDSVPLHDRTQLSERLDVELARIEFVHVVPQHLATCIERLALAQAKQQITGEALALSADDESIATTNYETLTRKTGDPIGDQTGQILLDLLLKAVALDASDIHIFGDRTADGSPCYSARLRVDGDMEPATTETGEKLVFPREVGDGIITRLVTAGRMNDNGTIPRSGRFEIELKQTRQRFDLRVEIIPQRGEGWFSVIRLLGGHKKMSMQDIYPEDESNIISEVRTILGDIRAGGMFLVVGATGSGKSTFLAAVQNYLNTPDLNLIAIENPIEHRIPGVRQIQVEPNDDRMGFVPAIESAMRLDPNVITVGELRSPETAKVAVDAAKTGHIVLSTLHVTDAASTPARLKDLGVEVADLASTLKGVLAQNLVRTKCAHCAQKGKSPVGCLHCGQRGWEGRAAIGEVLTATPEIEQLIRSEAPPRDISAAAQVRPKPLHAGALIAANRTDEKEVGKVLGETASKIAQEEANRLARESG